MDLAAIFLIAVALGVDAFAVALAAGTTIPRINRRHTFRLAWHFGLFQAGMTVIGWAGSRACRELIEDFDHWLAFGLLLIVGGRMIHGAGAADDSEEAPDPTRGYSLIVLAVATSIDALAVGLGFSVLDISIWRPALIIGLVALAMTAAGLHLGRLTKNLSRLGSGAEIAGGLILIALGIKILHDHQVF